VNALAAPIFETHGNIVLAMTAMGPAGTFDPAWDGEIANALRSCADTVSARLGYTPSTLTTAQKNGAKPVEPQRATRIRSAIDVNGSSR